MKYMYKFVYEANSTHFLSPAFARVGLPSVGLNIRGIAIFAYAKRRRVAAQY